MMHKKALIVVDMQNDFLTGTLSLKECPAKQDGIKIIPTVNRLISKAEWDLIIYTLDWHPTKHISFVTNAHNYQQHVDSEIETSKAEVYNKIVFDIDGKSREQIMWPPHCIQNSWGSKLHEDLLIKENSKKVYKGVNETVDSYSAFFDNDKINETSLQSILRENDIESTYICGVATDVCVNYTATDSNQLGFKTNVILDACAGVDHNNIRESIEKWKDSGIKLTSSDDVIEKMPVKVVKLPPKIEASRRSSRRRRPPVRYTDTWVKKTRIHI